MLGFESFVAIVVIGPFSTFASEISAEPCLIPVARFLATGSYGNRCDTALKIVPQTIQTIVHFSH